MLQSPTILTTNWIVRSDPRSTRETPVAPDQVSTFQLGDDVLVPPGAWNGLLEDHRKFITIKDLGKETIYVQVSELI